LTLDLSNQSDRHATGSGPGAGSASSGFGELIDALLNPNYDVVAIDLWAKLTDDDDLAAINGQRDQLEGWLQKRYGYANDQACKDVDTGSRH
jgi:hypothetical protein